MKRHNLTAVAFAAAVALAAPSAWAQGRPVGTPTGSAQPRGGGDGGSGGTALPRSGGSGGGGSTMGSAPSAPAMPATTFSRPSTPSAEPLAFAPQRRGGGDGGSSTGQHAVPRGSSGGGDQGSRGGTRAPSTASSGSGDRSGNQGAVPTYSRPRGERPVRGEAVPRTGSRPGTGNGGGYILPGYDYPYSYYYSPYGYYGYGPGYGLGLGYFYDPFWSPYGYGGLGYSYYGPYGGYGAYGYPYQGYYGGGGGAYDRDDRDEGSLRLKLKPREAQVYVDGYLVGDVDSFDGMFQKLDLPGGGHRIELKAQGYEPLQFDVLITPGETVTYKGEMKAIP